ncbi:MAG: hypothetical protein ACT4N2_02205 [Hyphomicrobium sp.]
MGVRLDEETWAEIRLAYETTAEPVGRIAARFGTSESAIYVRANRQGWAFRSRSARVIPEPPSEFRGGLTARRIIVRRPPPPVSAGDTATEGATESDGAGDQCSGETGPAADEVRLRDSREPDTAAGRAYRLLRLIDLQLDNMETRMSTGEPMSAQDHERQARAFGALVEHAETAMEILGGKDCGSDAARAADGAGSADAERLRREIAQRLERLNAQWLAQSQPRGAVG